MNKVVHFLLVWIVIANNTNKLIELEVHLHLLNKFLKLSQKNMSLKFIAEAFNVSKSMHVRYVASEKKKALM